MHRRLSGTSDAEEEDAFYLADRDGDLENSLYGSSYHTPVMVHESMDALLSPSASLSRPRIFVDGTLGGGGHSEAILERLHPGDILVGCDVDRDALNASCQRLRNFLWTPTATTAIAPPQRPIFLPVQSNFSELDQVLLDVAHPLTGRPLLSSGSEEDGGVDGLFLDLGVSSHQIDDPIRGFAFMKEGPLSMRMESGLWSPPRQDAGNDEKRPLLTNSGRGPSAADICNEYDEGELCHLLKTYGNESRAKSIARSIVNHRPLETTSDLVEAVAAVTPAYVKRGRRLGRMATLARVFQSLRIVVNEEDVALERLLTVSAPRIVRPKGRLAVLTYHSLEDRMTKQVMRDGAIGRERLAPERDIYGNIIEDPTRRPWKPTGKKLKATAEETERNPRSRSATLRVAERVWDKEEG